jgi:hypothetical protein
MHIQKYTSNNFSITIDADSNTIIKKPLSHTKLPAYHKQVELYNALKSRFGDMHNDTEFVLEEGEHDYIALSPHIQGELLCNLSFLDTEQLESLITLQKTTIILALETGKMLDFWGSNPHMPITSKKANILSKLHKLTHNHFSSNIIWSNDKKMVFIDTFSHIRDRQSPKNIKHIVFIVNLSILSFSLIKHYLQYITHKILHSIRP